ncbi:MAG: HD domain-containing protein [Patescibacteria group bacterium]|nr:HD domain-containing protein [Patescibacteria group bacterium]
MKTRNEKIISEIAKFVKKKFATETSGHDWWHIYRVWKMAKHIGKKESADMFIVELAALLHDIADWKFNNGDETIGPKVTREILSDHGVPKDITNRVCEIISKISFKGAGVKNEMETLEGKIVQDADRLDAIGAIGIARAFAYGGHKNRVMYDPEQKPESNQTKEEYMKGGQTTLNHFYEKLLLLKERMNTETAKKIAVKRHHYMENFLNRFYSELEGKS